MRTEGEEWSVTDRITGSSYVVTRDGENFKVTMPTISAAVISSSAAIAGGGVGVGVSIGLAFARNLIGWQLDFDVTHDKTTADESDNELTNGTKVKIEEGVRAGDIYEYIGPDATMYHYTTADSSRMLNKGDLVKVNAGYDDSKGVETTIYRYLGDDDDTVDLGNAVYDDFDPETTELWESVGSNRLSMQDYGNTDLWKQVNLVAAPVEVQAWIMNSSVEAIGDVTLTAISDQSIDALVVAGSAAASGGGVAVSVSGAGACAINTITTKVRSFIDNDSEYGDRLTSIDSGSVTMSADDTSRITAVTGAASLAAGFGGVGVAVSIGVAGAYNEISNEVSAFIADATVTADGTIAFDYTSQDSPNELIRGDRVRFDGDIYEYAGADRLDPDDNLPSVNLAAEDYTDGDLWKKVSTIELAAIEGATINSLTSAASLAVAIGGVGVAVSGAGAAATNIILTRTDAYVSDNSILVSTGDVAIEASDTSTIKAIVSASTAAIAGGAVGVGVSIGASFAANFIGLAGSPAGVQAYVKNSTITATGALTQTATADETIKAAVLAASVAIAAGGVGVGVSGTGVIAINMITSDIKAFIENSIITAGSVNLTADDTSQIMAFAGSATASAAFGGVGVAISIGAALAHNHISNEVEAYVKFATVNTTSGNLTIQAFEDATITATSVAASAAVSAGIFSLSISGGGATAINTIATQTRAFVSQSDLDIVGNLDIHASGTFTSSALTGSASVAGGLISVAMGGSIAIATVSPTIEAYIINNTDKVIDVAGSVSVTSLSSAKADVKAYGMAAGTLGVGVSSADAWITPVINTYISGGTVNAGQVRLLSLHNVNEDGSMIPDRGAFTEATASAGGLIGVNGAAATSTTNADLRTYVASGSTLTVTGMTTIMSLMNGSNTAKTDGRTGGAIAIGASSATASSDSRIEANIGDNVSLVGEGLVISACGEEDSHTESISGVGGAIAVSASSSTTTNTSTTRVSIGSGSVSRAIEVDSLWMIADHKATFNGQSDGSSGGAIDASGANITNTVNATVDAEIGENAYIRALNLDVQANNRILKDWLPQVGDATPYNLISASGGVGSFPAGTSETTIVNNTTVDIGEGARIYLSGQGASRLKAYNNVVARDKAKLDSGGALAVARTESIIRNDTNTALITVGGDANINSVGDMRLSAYSDADIDTTANTRAYGAAGYAQGKAISSINADNNIKIKAGALLRTDSNISLTAGADGDGNGGTLNAKAQTDLWNKSAFPIPSNPTADAIIIANSNINIESGAWVGSVQDVNLKAVVGDLNAQGNWSYQDLYLGLAEDIAGGLSNLFGGGDVSLKETGGYDREDLTTTVTVDGTVEAGIQNKQFLIIDENLIAEGDIFLQGNPVLDFQHVEERDTLTRNSGSWVDDEFTVGAFVTISGTDDNDGSYRIDEISLDGLTLYLDPGYHLDNTAEDNDAEVSQGIEMWGTPTIDFGNDDDRGTITRSYGSFSEDGFAVNQKIVVNGAGENDRFFTINEISPDGSMIYLDQGETLYEEDNVSNISIKVVEDQIFSMTDLTLDFDQVDGGPDKITRSMGSWIDDGFVAGQIIEVEGTTSNDGIYRIESLGPLTLTLVAEDELQSDESNVTAAEVSVTQGARIEIEDLTLDFDQVDGGSDTIARSIGSWIDDGFVAGQIIEVKGTTSNDGIYRIESLNALTLTLVEDDELQGDEFGVTGAAVSVTWGEKVDMKAFALDFDRVDGGSDTIARSMGSFSGDGFVAGQIITIAGSNNNDGSYIIDNVSADGLTLSLNVYDELSDEQDAQDLLIQAAGEKVSSFQSTGLNPLTLEHLDTRDTITRETGSFSDDRFVDGLVIQISGTENNNGSYEIEEVSADGYILYLSPTNKLVTEDDVTGVSMTAPAPSTIGIHTNAMKDSPSLSLTFTSVNNGPDTITRSEGSWRDDEFREGQKITVTGSVLNDGEYRISRISGDGLVLSLVSTDILTGQSNVSGVNITGKGVSDAIGDVGFTVEDLAQNLTNEITRLEKLKIEHYGNTTAVQGYENQIIQMMDQLEELKLTDTDEKGNIIPVLGTQVVYINVPDIKASSGDINIISSSLSGTGRLVSAGDARIDIINKSPYYLRIGDLIIPGDQGGRIIYNGVKVVNNAQIETRNFKDMGAVAFTEVISSEVAAEPVINVESTFNPATSSDKNMPAPDIVVQGSILNILGTARLFNNKGSIIVKEAITAKTVEIDAGRDFVLTSDHFFHVGGFPAGSDPDLSFDAGSILGNQVHFGSAHKLSTGQAVRYSSEGNAALDELIGGNIYYVIVVDIDSIKLAETSGGAAINISEGEGTHRMTPVSMVTPAQDIGTRQTYDLGHWVWQNISIGFFGFSFLMPQLVTRTDTITLDSAHGFTAAEKVRYGSGGGTAIGGLEDGETYYVIPVSAKSLRLAATKEDALQVLGGKEFDSGGSYKSGLIDKIISLNPGVSSGSSHFIETQVASSIIVGNNVYISARYLNINGTIQSGKPARSVTLESDLNILIADFRNNHNVGDPNLLFLSSNEGTGIETWYNYEKDRIELDNVIVEGGYMRLAGHIMSTGGGLLKVVDGFGEITVDNQTNYDLLINNLDTGGDGIEGKIEIVDTATRDVNIPNISTTIFERTGDAPRTDTYQPLAGQRYVYVTGTDMSVTTTKEWITEDLWTIDWLVKDPGEQPDNVSVVEGDGIPLPDGDLIEWQYTDGSPASPKDIITPKAYQSGGEYLISTRRWDTKHGWWIFSTTKHHLEKVYQRTDKKFENNSIKADHLIQIQFIGQDEGTVTVDSNADVLIGGAIVNKKGDTNITVTSAGVIAQISDTALLQGDAVTLSAKEGIGIMTDDQGEVIEARILMDLEADGIIDATTETGDILLTEMTGDMIIGQMTTGDGNIGLVADGNIRTTDNTVVVSGNHMDLMAGIGDIGEEENPLRVDSGDSLTARASGHIYLEETAGDLYLNQIESLGGDVHLTVSDGDLRDANTNDTRDTRAIEELTGLWEAMQLTDVYGAGDALQQNIEAYEGIKTREYHKYWKYRNQQANPDIYDPDFQVTLSADEEASYRDYYAQQGMDEDQINDAIATLEQKRTDEYHNLHGVYGGMGDEHDTDYAYSFVDEDPEEYEELRASCAWTEDELTNSMSGGILRRKVDTETRIEEPNIIGQRIFVDVLNGGVGITESSRTIDLSQELTEEEKIDLAAADRDDLTFFDAEDNVIDPSDNTQAAATIKVELREDIDIEVADAIIINARDHVYLGGEQDINIDQITGGNIIRIKGGEGIYNVATGDWANISGSGLIVEAAGETIGTEESALNIDLDDAGALTARARLGIYLYETAGDLNIDTVYSESGHMALGSESSIYDGIGSDQWNIKGLTLDLEAGDAIGTQDDFFDIDLDAEGFIKATAGRDIFVAETAGDLKVGQVISTNGDVSLTSPISILDEVELDDLEVDVAGNSIILNALMGGIGESGNDLDVDTAYSGDGALSATSALNAYIVEPIGPLYLNQISTDEERTAFIAALAGRILNGNPVEGEDNVLSGSTRLYASSDIGADDKHLKTSVGTLQGWSLNGAIWIENNGELFIDKVGEGDFGIDAEGHVEITTHSPLTVNYTIISKSADIVLTAGESPGAGDDLKLAGNAFLGSETNVILQAGDNVIIEQGATVTASGAVEIHGDYGNDDAAGSTISVYGSVSGNSIVISSADDDDIVNLAGVNAGSPTIVETFGGVDVVNIGSNAPGSGGVVNAVLDLVTVDSGSGNDVLNIDDTGDTTDNIMVLTQDHLAGLDMAEGVAYFNLEQLNIALGSGSDSVNVQGTSAVTTIQGNDGNEVFNITSDTDSLANGSLDAIAGDLNIVAGAGDHALNISDYNDSDPDSGVVITRESISGLSVGQITYETTGSFRGGINIWTGTDNDTVTIESAVAGSVTSIWLNAGDDSVTVADDGTGDDGVLIIHGEAGNDTVNNSDPAAWTADMIVFGDYGQVLYGDLSFPVYDGGQITEKSVANLVSLKTDQQDTGGDDSIETGVGKNRVFGGFGADTLTAGSGDDYIIGDNGELVYNNGVATSLRTTDSVATTGDDDVIDGGNGDNLVLAGVGSDNVSSGDGNDLILGDNGQIDFDAADSTRPAMIQTLAPTLGGRDTISTGGGEDVVFGGTASDEIHGGAAHDVLIGDHGLLDVVNLPPNQNFLSIFTGEDDGGGNDIIHGDGGDDFILGQQGADFLFGGAGQDDITGGHNVPFGADGDDVIDGGDDITIIKNGSGLTITDGGVTTGDDADAILGDNGLITRTVLGPESWQTYLPPFEDVIREIQRFDDIDLISGNDTIFGDAGQDIIHGQRGDDVIDGGTDDDELFGELGNDTIAGAQGNDILIADVGCIERAFNEDGLPRINENKSWHRDVLLEEVGIITGLVHMDVTPLRVHDSELAKKILSADLVILAGVYLPGGDWLLNDDSGAWDTDVLLIDIVDANDDMLHGGAGEDVLFGQRGDDTLDGDGDDDLLIGDTANNVVPFETDIPQIVNTIRLIGMTDGADIPVVLPFGGAVIVSPVTLRPGEFDLTSPDLTLLPGVVESFSQTAADDALTRTDGAAIVPFVAIVPDIVHHVDMLPGNDTIGGGSGDDLIIGDTLTVSAPLFTDLSEIEEATADVKSELAALLHILHYLALDYDLAEHIVGDVDHLHDIRLAGDVITGGDGDDTILGDDGLFLVPFMSGLPVEAEDFTEAALEYHNFLRDLEHVVLDFAYLTQEAHLGVLEVLVADAIAHNPCRKKPKKDDIIDVDLHDLAIGNDLIEGDAGHDTIIGDDGVLISSVVPGYGYEDDDIDDHSVTKEALKDQQKLRKDDLKDHLAAQHVHVGFKYRLPQKKDLDLIVYDPEYHLCAGNDTIGGGSGDDLVIGDVGVIVMPVVVDTPEDKKELKDLEKDVKDLLKDLENELENRQHHGHWHKVDEDFFDSYFKKAYDYPHGKDHSVVVTEGNDWLTGNEGDDILLGDSAAIVVVFAADDPGQRLVLGKPKFKLQDLTKDFDFLLDHSRYRWHSHTWTDDDDGCITVPYGQSNCDTISGGDGDDVLLGGQGKDSLSGGDGKDIVIKDKHDDECKGYKKYDVVEMIQDRLFSSLAPQIERILLDVACACRKLHPGR